jgi:hypothetical protein
LRDKAKKVRKRDKAKKVRKHHLDRRADKLIDAGAGDPDELLTTKQTAEWLDVSEQWLEIGRHKGYGPPYVRIAPRIVRYTRGDIRKYLTERTHQSTAEYMNRGAEART